jgi:hypothetical protein
MPAIPVLKSMGWGLVPVYVGQQVIGPGSHTVTAAQGVTDAQDAANLASSAGLDAGSVLYLDVENGAMMPNNQVDYVTSWVNEVSTNTSFSPGVYCSSVQTAQQVTNNVGAIPIWGFHPKFAAPSTIDLASETPPDPGQCGFATALLWQYRLNLGGAVTIKWTDSATGTAKSLVVDVNSAVVLDPSKGFPTRYWTPCPPPAAQPATRSPWPEAPSEEFRTLVSAAPTPRTLRWSPTPNYRQ